VAARSAARGRGLDVGTTGGSLATDLVGSARDASVARAESIWPGLAAAFAGTAGRGIARAEAPEAVDPGAVAALTLRAAATEPATANVQPLRRAVVVAAAAAACVGGRARFATVVGAGRGRRAVRGARCAARNAETAAALDRSDTPRGACSIACPAVNDGVAERLFAAVGRDGVAVAPAVVAAPDAAFARGTRSRRMVELARVAGVGCAAAGRRIGQRHAASPAVFLPSRAAFVTPCAGFARGAGSARCTRHRSGTAPSGRARAARSADEGAGGSPVSAARGSAGAALRSRAAAARFVAAAGRIEFSEVVGARPRDRQRDEHRHDRVTSSHQKHPRT
jgi:hypothetical protein